MRLKMIRADLVATLGRVAPALADNDNIPALKNFCFDGQCVMAYDSSLAIIAPCETEETFSVNGKTLLGLLSNSHSEEVIIELEDKNDVLIKAGKSRFHLPFMLADEYLFKEPEEKWLLQFKVDDELITGLEACLMTTSSDLTQAKLLGVALVPHAKNMVLYSCNGDSMTRVETTIKKSAVEALIPSKFWESLLRLKKETEAKTATVKISKDWITGELDTGYKIYGNLLVVDSLVDYEGLITKTIKGSPPYMAVPKELDGALSRARIIADADSAKTVLTVAKGKLSLHTETHDGLIEDTIAWPDKSEVTADVTASHVQKAIGVCDTMAITDRCTAYKKDNIFIIVSNMG